MSDSDSNFLWGATSISRVAGLPVRATFHLLENGTLPARKVGGRWVADRDKLIAFLRDEQPETAE